MLYERWMETARENRRETALRDLASGQSWTFQALAERTWPEPDDSVVCPSGRSVDFVFQVLAAWKHHRMVCPMESVDQPPLLTRGGVGEGIVHLKSTSATTGQARLIAFTGPQLHADADHIVTSMGLRADWPNLGVISLAHSYGFSNLILPLLLYGIPLWLADSPLPETLRSVQDVNANLTLPAVPALWRAWHDAGVIPARVRLAITAGAPMPLTLETSIYERTGIKVHNFYGASECGGITYDRSSVPRQDSAFVGTALDGVVLSSGADGCLEVRGAAVGHGYWPKPEAALTQGCFRTSDLVDLRGGEVYMRGRVTDMINVAGRKLSPESVEQVLLQHPQVDDCLAFGVPSREAERGEDIVMWVQADDSVSDSALRSFLLERLPAWQLPRDWRRTPALGVNDRGKRSRAEWKTRYLELIATEYGH